MKKVTTRAFAALIVAALVIGGLALYLLRLVRDGGDWASFYANDSVYYDATLNAGTITDRNGVVLVHAGDKSYSYADSSAVRTACLHAVGDIAGNIGTGALSIFRPELIDYSLLTGTTGKGGTVKLALDSELNVTAYEALAGRKGAVLVYNYQTGEILCMVSSPSYDPMTGFDESDPAYEGAYINRCISASLVPGSIFKIVTLAAALENDPGLWDETFYCGGSTTIGGSTVTCTDFHGYQTIDQAFANSCNCAFAALSVELGGQLIADYAAAYGLTSEHQLNGVSTKAGSVSVGQSDSDVAWEGIGQYEDLVCPFSMLRLVGAIANGGVCVEPTMLAGQKADSSALMRSDTAARLASMMNYNVQYHYGGDSRFPGLAISAKTGTAELDDGTSHAWFAGFLTNTDCPYAFVVLVEHGGGGLTNAGAVANTVLQEAVFG